MEEDALRCPDVTSALLTCRTRTAFVLLRVSARLEFA